MTMNDHAPIGPLALAWIDAVIAGHGVRDAIAALARPSAHEALVQSAHHDEHDSSTARSENRQNGGKNNVITFVPSVPDGHSENDTGAGPENGTDAVDAVSMPENSTPAPLDDAGVTSRTPAPSAKKRHTGRPKGLSKTRREVWDWIHAHRGHKLTIDVVHAGTGRARGLCGEVLSLYREWLA